MTPRPGTVDGGEPISVEGYRDWWSIELQLWRRDLDARGHLTTPAYGAVYQQVLADFLEHAWHDPDPSFVIAKMSLDCHHEVQRDESPIRAYVAVRDVDRSTFETTMVLCTSDGRMCSTARTGNVAWDRGRQRSRPLSESERNSLLRHAVRVAGVNPDGD
jgi:acyl-CoA thioesterase FadM